MNRRTFLSAGAGALAGGGLMAAMTTGADAAVRLDQLSVDGGSHEVTGDVSAVTIAGEVGYNFDVPERAPQPEMFQIKLCVGPDDERIGAVNGRPTSRTGSGALEIEGNVLESGAFSASDFQPGEDSATVELPVVVQLDVLGSNDTVAQASQRDTATVTVSQAGYDASLHGATGGELSVSVSGE